MILSAGVVDAQIVFPDNVQGNELTINHGDSFDVTFNLKNDHLTNKVKDISINLVELDLGIGSWTAAKIGSSTLTISPSNVVDLGSIEILPGTSSDLITLTYKTNKFTTAPNTYSGSISFSAIYDPTGGSPQIPDIDLEITVDSSPSLSITPKTQTRDIGEDAIIIINNDGNINLLNIVLSETTNFGASFSSSNFGLILGASGIDVTVILDSLTNLKFGNNNIIVQAKDSSNPEATDTATITVQKTFCSNGQIGEENLTIRDIDINNKGKGKDDEWQLLDTIEIEVDVKNIDDENIDDVFVELALFDSSGINVIRDLDFENKDEEEFDIGKIRDKDTETARFIFKVPADFDDLGNYKFAVKAYSDDLGEENLCVDTSNDLSDRFFDRIEVVEDEDNIIAVDEDSIVINPKEVICGETVFVTLDVFNVGGEGEEDQTRVTMEDKDLKVNEEFIIRKDLDEGDKASVEFSFIVPDGIEEKQYTLEFRTEYDYKRGDYFDESDDTWIASLEVISCGRTPSITGNVIISELPLGSAAKAGEELIVNLLITNSGTEASKFTINAKDYNSWADLDSISQKEVLPLGPGESKEIKLIFNVKEGISGARSFTLEVRDIITGEIEVQLVEIEDIEGEDKGFSFSGLQGNSLIWLIAIINIILIVLIILVAVRLSRR
ncbi:MAG: putative S-layer protein [Nanoarchaeota archaeon]|nr:putative S-layer protein [Nanoarchaeota archaeon]